MEKFDELIVSDKSYFSCVDQFDEGDSEFCKSCLFDEDNIYRPSTNNFCCSNSFGFNFDRGTIFLQKLHDLFKMAKYSYMQLEAISNSCPNYLIININKKNVNNCIFLRREIVHLLLYLKTYIRMTRSCSEFKWLKVNIIKRLKEELISFISFCGSVAELPEYISNDTPTSDNMLGNKNLKPCYHVFHCHLDMKWHYVTLLYELIVNVQDDKDGVDLQTNDSYLTLESLQIAISDMISDLVIIALKRFHRISASNLVLETAFNCKCVAELWGLLKVYCDKLHSKHFSQSFWFYVNQTCKEIINREDMKTVFNDSNIDITQDISATNILIFTLWLLGDLSRICKAGDTNSELDCNYNLLESCLKSFLNSEVNEFQVRIALLLTENILENGWEERTEVLVLFWEYFHKRMNSSFSISDSSVSEALAFGESASRILKNLTARLNTRSVDRKVDSFHLFLRLLALKLKKWHRTPLGLRRWNQLKGRILSKFSASKLSTLNEIGLYHFILLFLTLAMTSDMKEMSMKLQMFLQSFHVQDVDEVKMKLVVRAHVALVLLFLERNEDVGTVSNALLDSVEYYHNSKYISLIRVFVEGFQELIECTDNLDLGQYKLIGNWISTFLSCSEMDTNRFFDSVLLLVRKMDFVTSVHSALEQNNHIVFLNDSLWKYLVPNLKMTNVSFSNLHQIPDIAAIITAVNLKPCLQSSNKMKSVHLFTFFTTDESVDVNVLCRYIGQLSQSEYACHIFDDHNLILMKAWLRCLILLTGNDDNEHLCQFTSYIYSTSEMKSFLSSSSIILPHSSKHYFENFVQCVQTKYYSFEDFQLKNKFFNQFSSYFSCIDKWFSYLLKLPKSAKLISNTYRNIGLLFVKIPHLLYIKSKSNSILQNFLDLLLLPLQFRNPQFKLHPYVDEAIKKTIHLYIHGLFVLDPENDIYIARCIRELIIIYVPRLISPRGSNWSHECVESTLLQCFENSEYVCLMSKTIFEILCNTFFKKRAKIPHQFTLQASIFFYNLIKQYKNDDRILSIFVNKCFDRICDVLMFCEATNPCKLLAKEIVHLILNSNLISSNFGLGNEVTSSFEKLCQEHLAFTSRSLFDLFEEFVGIAPELVFNFLPLFRENIKAVENKRGVGYDQSLRKGLERIEDALKRVRRNN